MCQPTRMYDKTRLVTFTDGRCLSWQTKNTPAINYTTVAGMLKLLLVSIDYCLRFTATMWALIDS